MVGAGFALYGAVELRDVRLNLLLDEGGRVFLPGGCEDHGEEAFGFGGEVLADVGVEGSLVGVLVGGFDGVHVCVAASDEDVVKEGFVGAGAFESFVQGIDIVLQRSAQDGEKGEAEVRGGFLLDVGFKGAMVAGLVGLFEVRDFGCGDVG